MSTFLTALHVYLQRFQKICVDHAAGIVFAFLIGISVLAPQLIWRADARYQGIDLMGLDAEEHYIARVNDVYKGNIGLGNTFLPDKDKPYLQPPLGEIIQAGVSRVLFLNVTDGILAAKFIFPFLMALTIYALAYLISRSRIAALLGQASAMLGHLLMSGVKPWLDLLGGALPIGSYTLYSRPINPQVSSLLMFIGLFVIYRAFFVREKARVWEIVLIGALTGASVYINPYTFTFMGGIIAVSCIWFFFKRDFARAFSALYAGVVGLVLCIPFAINYLALKASPDFLALAERQGLVPDHAPVLSIWLVVMLGLLLFLWPKIYSKSRIFFIIAVVVLWIFSNQQVLTGLVLHPSHYHWYITKPLLGIMLGMYAAFLLQYFFKNQYLRAGLAGLGVFILFYTSPLLHIGWYAGNPDPPVLVAQTYAPVLRTLSTLPPNQVVWADPGLSAYVAVYTTHSAPNTFSYVVYYLNPASFYESSLFVEYRLAGETPSSVLAAFTRDRVKVSEKLFGLYYRQTKGDLAAIPDETLKELAEKYRASYTRPLVEVLRDLKITVVVAPTGEKARYDRMPGLHLFESQESYTLYTVAQ